MSDPLVDYIDFDIVDYTGSSATLSSYSLELTPIRFIPILSSTTNLNLRFIWDTGDGVKINAFSPSYVYKMPGRYTITLAIYSSITGLLQSSISKQVIIKDILEDNITITCNSLVLTAGKVSQQITISQTLPIHQFDRTVTTQRVDDIKTYGFTPRTMSVTPKQLLDIDRPTVTTVNLPTSDELKRRSSIIYTVSGANSPNFFFLETTKYTHLESYNCLYKQNYISSLSSYDLVPVSIIQLPLTAVYAKSENGAITTTTVSSANVELAGYIGTDAFVYRDDTPCNYFTINFNKPSTKIDNFLGVTLSGSVLANSPTKIVVNSTGILGDNQISHIFDIDKNKFNNTDIHFVAVVTDNDGDRVKYTSKLQYPLNFTVDLVGNNVQSADYTITSLQHTLTNINAGGYFRGLLRYTGQLTSPLSSVYLSAVFTDTINTEADDIITTETSLLITTEADPISIASAAFNIYPQNYYTLVKKNEDFNTAEMLQSLAFQETMLDKPGLFDDFFGTILGGDVVDVEALGTRVYERIANFIDNNVNIDTAEIAALLSYADMLSNNSLIYDSTLASFPSKLKRLVGLLSINRDKLFGETNKFIENLNPNNTIIKDVYGRNLGSEIDTTTYVITAGKHIVAYEKFSRSYKLLNTFQPLSASPPTSTTYMLSGYDRSWGWPLLLPQDTSLASMKKYYMFYEHIPTIDGTIVGSVLNFEHTTVPQSTSTTDLVKKYGIFENIILDTLYQSLSLTK